MIHNLNDSQLDWLVETVLGIMRENPLESASVSDGRVRFIRGLLRMDSGARLEGVGTFDWTGPGSIAGDWEVLGGGVIRVGGVLISPVGGGRIMIGAGPVGIVLDGSTGTLTMGNIRMEGGKIYVGTGTSQIVIDGATGKILAGDVEIELDKITVGGGEAPATLADGALRFETGGVIEADLANTGVKMRAGANRVYVGENAISVQVGSRTLIVTTGGFYLLGLDPIPQDLTIDNNPRNSLYIDPDSEALYRVVGT